jgi:cell wall-associated NlpC family hydrolase
VTRVGSRGGIGSPSSIGDSAGAEALAELEKIKEQLRGGKGVENASTPNVANARAPADRAGAMATLEARAVGEPPADALDEQITDKLRDMGYLPKPPEKVSKEQVDAATQKFITDNLDNADISGDIELLIGLLEAKMQKQNARANGGGGGMRGSRPPEGGRPSGLPPSSTFANRGPAPNAGALQNQAAQNIANAKPPPAPGSIQAKVAEAAQKYMGTSTAAGPDGGNLACAWSVNNILSNAGLQKVGSNPNYVPSVEQALQGGRGTKIDAADAGPGDIVIWPNGHHIGIAMGNGQVANNSSSRASFSNMQALPPGCRVYRLNS